MHTDGTTGLGVAAAQGEGLVKSSPIGDITRRQGHIRIAKSHLADDVIAVPIRIHIAQPDAKSHRLAVIDDAGVKYIHVGAQADTAPGIGSFMQCAS